MKTFKQYLREYIDLEELNLDYFLDQFLSKPLNSDHLSEFYKIIWEGYLYELLEENLILTDGKSISVNSMINDSSLKDYDCKAYINKPYINILLKEESKEQLEDNNLISLIENNLNQEIHQHISRHIHIKFIKLDDLLLDTSYVSYQFGMDFNDSKDDSKDIIKVLILEKLQQLSNIYLSDDEYRKIWIINFDKTIIKFHECPLEFINKKTKEYFSKYGHRLGSLSKGVNSWLLFHWKKE